jgi:hypothetical protein
VAQELLFSIHRGVEEIVFCHFYNMIQGYYKKNPKDAEETGLRICQNDEVVDELTEKEAVNQEIL